MDEVDNLVKILLENPKASDVYHFGYIQNKVFVFNYGSGPKLSFFQENLFKAYIESAFYVYEKGYKHLKFDILKKQILDSYFNVP